MYYLSRNLLLVLCNVTYDAFAKGLKDLKKITFLPLVYILVQGLQMKVDF